MKARVQEEKRDERVKEREKKKNMKKKKKKKKAGIKVLHLFHVVIAARFESFVASKLGFGAQPRAHVFAPVAIVTCTHR